jgi:hypothetical protein
MRAAWWAEASRQFLPSPDPRPCGRPLLLCNLASSPHLVLGPTHSSLRQLGLVLDHGLQGGIPRDPSRQQGELQAGLRREMSGGVTTEAGEGLGLWPRAHRGGRRPAEGAARLPGTAPPLASPTRAPRKLSQPPLRLPQWSGDQFRPMGAAEGLGGGASGKGGVAVARQSGLHVAWACDKEARAPGPRHSAEVRAEKRGRACAEHAGV